MVRTSELHLIAADDLPFENGILDLNLDNRNIDQVSVAWRRFAWRWLSLQYRLYSMLDLFRFQPFMLLYVVFLSVGSVFCLIDRNEVKQRHTNILPLGVSSKRSATSKSHAVSVC